MSIIRTGALLGMALLAGTWSPGETGMQNAGGTGDWRSLFDGKTLTNWKPSDFFKPGSVSIEDGQIKLGKGTTLTGITWIGGEIPRTNYEVSLQAMKVKGDDFFCGLTFPVADSHCTLIVGGWGGGVVGLSSIDYQDASENETSTSGEFAHGRWYSIRVRVTPKEIEAWIDEKPVVNLVTTDRDIDVRIEMTRSTPLGIAAYKTEALLRDIKVRRLD